MKILRAHINKDRTLTASYEHTDKNGIKWTSENVTGSATIHIDLQAAFNDLVNHVIPLCKFKEGTEDFTITCINLKEKGDNVGIVISGMRACGKRAFNFNTPYINMGDDDYAKMNDLAANIDTCISEVTQYLKGTKFTAKQAELPLAAIEE